MITTPQIQEEINKLVELQQYVQNGRVRSLAPFLKLLFNLKGKPYNLNDHFVFEPLFEPNLPTKITIRASRQIGKSVSISALGVFIAASIPFCNVMFVTPLQEQVLRFSSDAVKPFLEESPIRQILQASSRSGSVLRKELVNRSILYFMYAFLSAERVRGTAGVELLFIDECQDMNPDHLPVLLETQSASNKLGVSVYTGTSKTRETALEYNWESSSQAHWVVKCQSCNKHNIFSTDYDLLNVIGPYRDDICEDRPATICSKCGKFINPRFGRWEHKYRNRIYDFAGYHIPQCVMPMHYNSPQKWKILLGKQRGVGNYTHAKFINEVLGEPSDESVKLVSKTDLENAGTLNDNVFNEAIKQINKYSLRILSIDWGGGGEEGISKTVWSVVGITPQGNLECFFGYRSLDPDHTKEALLTRKLFDSFKCNYVAHDFTGAGDVRESILVHLGLPRTAIIPIAYVRSAKANVINFKPATINNPRAHWTVDKARSLQLTSACIKFGKLKFFKYDYKSAEDPGLLHDFLALVELSIETRLMGNVYTIQRNPMFPDDFAQSVNIGCCAIWHMTNSWPNFDQLLSKYAISSYQENLLNIDDEYI